MQQLGTTCTQRLKKQRQWHRLSQMRMLTFASDLGSMGWRWFVTSMIARQAGLSTFSLTATQLLLDLIGVARATVPSRW